MCACECARVCVCACVCACMSVCTCALMGATHVVGVLDDGGGVGGEEVLALVANLLPDAQEQRGALARTHDDVGLVRVHL